uniref:TP6A_N domain-containing protein n=1 Tax=Gongylonema pulchrum TaxID=637853 RepID=A0A183ED61_9BILA
LHECVFDRTQSRLRDLRSELCRTDDRESTRAHILIYLQRLSHITGSLIRCYSLLRFLEVLSFRVSDSIRKRGDLESKGRTLQVDSHGNRFLAAEETPINTPAIASAIVTKDFERQTSEQISLRVSFALIGINDGAVVRFY